MTSIFFFGVLYSEFDLPAMPWSEFGMALTPMDAPANIAPLSALHGRRVFCGSPLKFFANWRGVRERGPNSALKYLPSRAVPVFLPALQALCRFFSFLAFSCRRGKPAQETKGVGGSECNRHTTAGACISRKRSRSLWVLISSSCR